jgi:hypothetical protein
MPEVLVMVLDDPKKTEEVLEIWLAHGITGATILDSTGLSHELCNPARRDDLPIIPSLSSVLQCREEPHRTLFAVIPADIDLDSLAKAIEAVVGPFQGPYTAVMFTMPVGRTWGIGEHNSLRRDGV